MTQELVPHHQAVPAINRLTPEQKDLIKKTVAVGATDDELALLLYTAERMGLDPLARQIHMVKRGYGNDAKMSIQVGIDGYRLIADRTGKYAGNDDPVFGDVKTSKARVKRKDGWEETTYDHPATATVTVWKLISRQRCPFTATARWSEYYPGDSQGFMWRKLPFLMLGKTAEALALRKAFPAELSGVYTDEEMDQADGGGIIDVTPARPALPGGSTVDEQSGEIHEPPKPATPPVPDFDSLGHDRKPAAATAPKAAAGQAAAPAKPAGQTVPDSTVIGSADPWWTHPTDGLSARMDKAEALGIGFTRLVPGKATAGEIKQLGAALRSRIREREAQIDAQMTAAGGAG